MGLKLTLEKDKNGMYYDFIDAYWAIDEIGYSTTACSFDLKAYPTREAKLKNMYILDNPSIGVGSARYGVVDSYLYIWKAEFPITDIFPQGIPLDENEQKTTIYNFIKTYTGLPFEDVLES